MNWYLYIHPLIQIGTLIIGITNLKIGFNLSKTWTLPVRKHRALGLIFVALLLSGTIIGWQVNRALNNTGMAFYIAGHRFIAWLIIILLFLIMISGFISQKYQHRSQWFRVLHSGLSILLFGLMFAQLFGFLLKVL